MDIFKDLKESYSSFSQIDLLKNFKEIFAQPIALFTLLGLIVLVIILLRTRKFKFTTQGLTRIALLVALSVILDYFKIYRFPQGGSITLGSMVPLLLAGIWYGPEAGFLAGMVFGVISLILGPYIVHPIQVLFDYPLPFMLLGTAAYFKRNKFIGVIFAVALRFICHIISGVIFFADYAPEGQSPLLYSIIYNGSYLIPELIICLIILAILPVDRIRRTVS